ncbi:LysR substrate-binding domain-containing protein [Streptomyces cocklensis]|jgi:DNA-binding transcriptional LysR family regulator|uniref:DNA-binding transcriptional regulator, LysR family n=1 Tax=Actinacidiphila cocklensis TaxID=887465 RepID=A0A9W4DU13_9ACTN|nr:LysR family transcriptional regulator [Actinacidiphila cocklensis]MDD1061803.1 LysR substrate-binding domain-containing protein [Actinacidiphila cocklensis]WSX76047.1 LysR substrate-binding domain-containing protein [Streptomyces sp. NBC_00899]CAG6396230.1 DNA-binding transcriptional regulator, LysR family [Actinacidiphila cocklensis]
MKDWDLRKLQILRALHDTGTVTAAAAALRMTPSAVSQQLAALSKQVGTPVIEARGRGVRLTGAAHVLLRHAEIVFAQLERAGAEIDGWAQGEAGVVRIGTIATAITRLVVPAVALLRRSAPGITVSVREAEAAEVYEQLAAGDVDLALSLAVDAPTAGDPRFVLFPLLTDPLDIALPPGHPLAAAPALRLAQLAEDPWIFGSRGPWRDLTLAACADAGFVPEQAHAAADWPAIFSLVAAGMGIALVPRMATAGGLRQEVVVRALEADRPRRRIVGAVRGGAQDAPLLRRTLEALRQAADLDPLYSATESSIQ